MTTAPRIRTDRLLLLALDADALDACIAGDRERLSALTGATFPVPLVAPPLLDDALPYMRDQLRAAPADVGWWPWLIVVAETGQAVGVLGLAGRPDDDDSVLLGYSLYPHAEGHGFATEAAQALIGWALGQPGVQAVRATIPVGHTPSLRVAARLGMRQIGTAHDAEAGMLGVFETHGAPAADQHAPDRDRHDTAGPGG
jgi:RimJ/RimL family protein N-acetyltransferase